MALGPYKPRPAGSLKAAVSALVAAAGGLDRAAERTRLSRSRIHACTDDAERDRHLPVDVLLALELQAGAPVVTRYLAAEQGCALLELAAPAGVPLSAETARLAGEVAEFFQALSRDLSDDHRIDGREAGGLLAELDDILVAAAAVRAGLVSIRDEDCSQCAGPSGPASAPARAPFPDEASPEAKAGARPPMSRAGAEGGQS
jgi:hypothetical protein